MTSIPSLKHVESFLASNFTDITGRSCCTVPAASDGRPETASEIAEVFALIFFVVLREESCLSLVADFATDFFLQGASSLERKSLHKYLKEL